MFAAGPAAPDTCVVTLSSASVPASPALVPLDADEYDVTYSPGRHRGHADGPDPVRAAQSVTEGIAGKVEAGLGLLRATAGLGFRLIGLSRMPLQLTVGPLGRAATQQADAPTRPPLSIRSLGEDVATTPEAVESAYPHATEWLAVFVPPQGSDESCWRTAGDAPVPGYPARLAGLLDWTPVHLRADETVGLDRAGVELSALLQDLVESWPVTATRIALLGYGTGGLVARGACGVRAHGPQPWTALVTDLIALDTPSLAARRQRGSRDLGRKLDERLAGIISADDALVDVPPLEGVRHVLVTDRLTSGPNPVGRVLGDLLWWRQRATLRQRKARDLFPTAERYEVSTADGPLTNHPEVQHALLQWLA